jgi:ribosome-binding protein aMBF1 (putative translation factor)
MVRTRYTQPVADQYVVANAGTVLRQARQRMKLTEKEAATKLNIKEALLLGIESGKLQPDDAMVKKLERFYGVSLKETY